jgi:hypothetical protein
MIQLGERNRQAGLGDVALVRRNRKTKVEMANVKRARTPVDAPAIKDSDRPDLKVERRTQSASSAEARPTVIHELVSRPKKRTSDSICRDGASSPEDARAPRAKSRASQARKLENAQPKPKTPPQGWVPSPRLSPYQESRRPWEENEVTLPSATVSTASLVSTNSTNSTSTEHGPRESLESLVDSQGSHLSSSTQTVTRPRPSSTCSTSDPADLAALASAPTQGDARFATPVPLTKDTLQKVAMAQSHRRSKRPSSRSTWSSVSSRNGSECRFSVATSRTALSELDDNADALTVATDLSGYSTLSRGHRFSAQHAWLRSVDYAGSSRPPSVLLGSPEWTTGSRSESCTPYDRVAFPPEVDVRRSRSQGPDMGIRRVGSDKTGYRSRLHGRPPYRPAGVRRSASDRSASVSSSRPPPSPSVPVNEDRVEHAIQTSQKRLSLPDTSSIHRSASDRTGHKHSVSRLQTDTRAGRSLSERSRVNPLTRDTQSHATSAMESKAFHDDDGPSAPRDRGFRHSLPATLSFGETRIFATISERSADKLRKEIHERMSPGHSFFLPIRRDIIPVQFDPAAPAGLPAEPQFYLATAGRLAAASPGLDSIAESASSDQSGEPKLRRKPGSRQLRETPESAVSSGMSCGSTLSLSSTNPPPSVDQPSSLEDMDETFLSAGESADCDFFSMADSNGPPNLKPNDPFLPLVGLAVKELLRQYHDWTGRECKETKGSKPTRSGAKREGGVRKPASKSVTKRRVSNADSPVSDEEGDGVTTKTAKKAKTGAVPRRLACPFWKKDPDNHFQCYRKTLSRIKYVKQHLYKCHQAPIHCYRCGAMFEDEASVSEHVRTQECDVSTFRHEGLERAQVDLISRRADPSLSEQDQWFKLWDIIFPGQARPQSAYIDNELSEDLCNFREFLEAEGAHNLQHYMSTFDPNYRRDEATIARERLVWSRVLDALYTDWLGRRRDRLQSRIHTHSRSQSSSDSPAETPTIPELPAPDPPHPGLSDHDPFASDSVDPELFSSPEIPYAEPGNGPPSDPQPQPTLVHETARVNEHVDPFVGYSSPEPDYHMVHRANLGESPGGHGYYS